ncbi:protein FAM83E [Latimeria chalumnae]|uniref:protein FAM83E n=1 Tax=Latimeria chalumnae TaxID=7897 RepID=UPI0003C1794B|nr:PREDICTED: protein FAM83E [Latimeria chalumnae]|eukprot:XP_006009721.1 PREDICTED: protein FAM83E [Latimeria chalumnae]
MANSQILTLDDDFVATKVTEDNPEFYYSEDQRLALEALLTSGPAAFHKYLEMGRVRGFLSQDEVARIEISAERHRPAEAWLEKDAELEDDLSLTYWPNKSDVPIPDLDLGWSEEGLWKGITRAMVYTHPPAENQPHIKEMVRRRIQNAQKVVAIVMDVFTDVDVFSDLVEAAMRRDVSVYLLLGQENISAFLAMVDTLGVNVHFMERLRVRVVSGCTFCSRTMKKVRGKLKEKFVIVDGESVITGTYSFTWMDSRLERNIVTLLTGQVADVFEREFRVLYAESRPLQRPALFRAPDITLDKVPGLLPAAHGSTWDHKAWTPKYQLSSNGFSGPLKFQPVDLLTSSFATLAMQHSKSVNLNKIAERRSVAPPPAKSSGAPAFIKRMSYAGQEVQTPVIPPREIFKVPDSTVRHKLATCRNFEGPGRALGVAENHSSLSDILKNVQKSKMSAAKTVAARTSKSLWDLSRISQASGSSADSSTRGESRSRPAPKDTPAMAIMRYRGTTHAVEEHKPREPTYYSSPFKHPAPFSPLRLQGQKYLPKTSHVVARPWINPAATNQHSKQNFQ